MERKVTVIPGDGIGPEVVASTRAILDASGAQIEWEVRHAGASVFKQGIASGVPQDTIESIKQTRCVLKGPLETPVGFGEKSANVTLRKLFETYGNIRPVKEMPGVATPYAGRGVDLVVVRENVEDLYAGIEHMQTTEVAQCLKLISRKGCEKVVRLAFEVARSQGRRKVACATKANIMKMTEGLLKRVFEEVAPEYPDIEASHIIIDNCAHQLVKKPEQFEVILTTNMNGDILSDLTSALVGGLGFAPSANIGSDIAIFEAVHGSAPKYAGKDVINPCAMILSGVMMLRHLGYLAEADRVENAVLRTLEDGRLTRDVVGDQKAISTSAFTEAVIANLGKRPMNAPAAREHKPLPAIRIRERAPLPVPHPMKTVGADVFIESRESPDRVAAALEAAVQGMPVKLKMISNRGTQVYPSTGATPDTVDHYRCRFLARDAGATLEDGALLQLVSKVGESFRWMHVEKLATIGGKPAYTLAQGES
jgi:isocitrate dehydrogenase